MLGLILCGGQSTRMGTDKGLIKLYADTWAKIAVDKLSLLQLSILLSVNKDQYDEYAVNFGGHQLIKDDPGILVKGPLAGILSTHINYPDQDLLVLACDMPLMDITVLNELLLVYAKFPSHEAYIFLNDNQPEPLCAIYTAKGLSHVLHLLQSGKLARHSMKFVLDQTDTYTIPLEEGQKKYFRNINSPAELNNL